MDRRRVFQFTTSSPAVHLRNIAFQARVRNPEHVAKGDVRIGRLLNGNKAAPLVVYCNGPHCGKTQRLAAELRDAGYFNVRRYQLGTPTWRAAGGVCAIELDLAGPFATVHNTLTKHSERQDQP